MSSFRTIVSVTKPPFAIAHGDGIVSMGSCFSEHIGRNFERFKFDIDINPFGQQYNPASITTAIHRLLANISYTATELIEQDGLYHSLDHHGSFSRGTIEETLDAINKKRVASSQNIKKANILFLTLGTAHVFKWRETGLVVSNCHKIPSAKFEMELLKPEVIVAILKDALTALWLVNPTVQVIFTVSPVRYFAFGHYDNTVSKAHLFTAIHSLQALYPQLYYFPAYEMMMDDLRDYRFYADDMLHPSSVAIDYIWKTLCNTVISKETIAVLKAVEEIRTASTHRPHQPHSDAHRRFVTITLQRIAEMEALLGLNFEQEKSNLTNYSLSER